MKIDIDFDELLNNAVNAAVNASTAMIDKNRDTDAVSKQYQLISTVAANTTISILRDYHHALENALSDSLDIPQAKH